jgi:F-type H+-transporting ATPase subunit a
LIGLFAFQTEPLAAEKLFSIGPIIVTNALLFGAFTGAFLVGLLMFAAKYSSVHPMSKLAYYVELLVDFIWGAAIDTFGDRKTALKHLPLLGTLFCLILVGNLSGSGLLPGVGTITYNNGQEVSALLRPFTTDLNATLAMAVTTIGLVQYYAIKQKGFRKHTKHYFTTVSPSPYNPMNYFIGLIEIFGELLRLVTLSMRLFGVIYAGEVLISAVGNLAGNLGFVATVPTVLLEIFFSVIQAYVFMMLSATYLSVAVADEHAESESNKEVKGVA